MLDPTLPRMAQAGSSEPLVMMNRHILYTQVKVLIHSVFFITLKCNNYILIYLTTTFLPCI